MGQIILRVAEQIKQRELQAGQRLSHDQLAREMGLAPDVITPLLNNQARNIDLPMLAKLCDYFQCTVGDLIYYDADPTTVGDDEVESRDIVARWEQRYGLDEHPPAQ